MSDIPLIELWHTTRGEAVGALQKNGQYKSMPWLGFLHIEDAKNLDTAQPVKLEIARVGHAGALCPSWTDVEPGKQVQARLVQHGVYAVVGASVKVV